MINKLAIAVLTATLLAAGAYKPQVGETSNPANVTVITKNQAFPLKGAGSSNSCAASLCQDV